MGAKTAEQTGVLPGVIDRVRAGFLESPEGGPAAGAVEVISGKLADWTVWVGKIVAVGRGCVGIKDGSTVLVTWGCIAVALGALVLEG